MTDWLSGRKEGESKASGTVESKVGQGKVGKEPDGTDREGREGK